MLKCNQRYWSLQKNLTVAVNYQRLERWAPLHEILYLKNKTGMKTRFASKKG